MDIKNISDQVEWIKLSCANAIVWLANASAWATTDYALKIVAACLGIVLTIFSLRFVYVRIKHTKATERREQERHALEVKERELSIQQKKLELEKTQPVMVEEKPL